MLNCEQTAAKLNISVVTLRNMRKASLIPPHSNPSPGRYEWREEDIERFCKCFPRNMEEFNKII